jgi:opacity protein-like surface antigen
MKLSKILLLLLTASSASLVLAGVENPHRSQMKLSLTESNKMVNATTSFNSNRNSGISFEVFAGTQNTKSDADKSTTVNGIVTHHLASSTDDTDGIHGLSVSYTFPKRFFNDKLLVGLGLDSYLGDIEMGTEKLTSDNGKTNWNTYELEDMFSIYVKPQYIINHNKVAYAKLGYVAADLVSTNQDEEFVSISDKNMNGFLAGIGYKQFFSKCFFALIEANYIKFEDKHVTGHFKDYYGAYDVRKKVDADAFNFRIGIGYQIR